MLNCHRWRGSPCNAAIKIEAIRIVREALGIGLKEAKEYVEQHGSNTRNATRMVAPVRRGDSGGGWR